MIKPLFSFIAHSTPQHKLYTLNRDPIEIEPSKIFHLTKRTFTEWIRETIITEDIILITSETKGTQQTLFLEKKTNSPLPLPYSNDGKVFFTCIGEDIYILPQDKITSEQATIPNLFTGK